VTGTVVEVVGAAQYARTLRAFGDELQSLTTAHHAAGAAVQTLARGRARRRSGRLAASFTVAVADTAVTIGSPVVYAGVQEYGWARRGITPSRALTSALEDSAGRVEQVYTADVETALSKVRGA